MIQEKIYQTICERAAASSPKIDTIVFDIGNVMVDFRWREFLKDFSYPEEINKRLSKAIFQAPLWRELDKNALPEEEMFRQFIQYDPELEEEIRRCLVHLGDTIEPFPHSIPLIEQLSADGFSVYYLSNYSQYLYDLTKDKLHSFTKLMKGGIYSFDVHMAKPEAEFYQLLLDRFHLTPSRCLFLDDKPENIEAARSLSFHGLEFHMDSFAPVKA